MRNYFLTILLIVPAQIFSQPCTGTPVLQRMPADTTIEEQEAFSFSESKNMFSDPDSHPLTYKLWYWNNDSSIWTLTLPSWLTVTENDTAFLFSGTTPYVCEETKDTLQFRAYNVCGDSSAVSFHVTVQNSQYPVKMGYFYDISLHLHRHNVIRIPLYDYFNDPNGQPLHFVFHINDQSGVYGVVESAPPPAESHCEKHLDSWNGTQRLRQTRIQNDTLILEGRDNDINEDNRIYVRLGAYNDCILPYPATMEPCLQGIYYTCRNHDEWRIDFFDESPGVNHHNPDVLYEPADSIFKQLYRDTFCDDYEDDDGGRTNLTYTCKLYNGDPLPSWMQFDSLEMRLTGRVPESSCAAEYEIDLTARDTSGNTGADNFFVRVSEKPPEAYNNDIKPIIALAGNYWSFTVPYDAARSPLGETIYYNQAEETGYGELPYWMSYNENTRILSGNAPSYAENYSISVFARHDCSIHWELCFEVHCQNENTVFAQGAGTEANPYRITTADDLHNVRAFNLKTGKYFKQMNDVDLTGWQWLPIGEPNYPFKNVFDGNNKKITGLTMDRGIDYVGLFGYVENAQIKNVVIEDCNISAITKTGALTGRVGGTSVIENCSASGSVRITQSIEDYSTTVGGLIGVVDSGAVTLQNLSFNGTVNGFQRAGGLIGLMLDGSSLQKSHSEGTVSLTSTSGSRFAGGLIGVAERKGGVGTVGSPLVIQQVYSHSSVYGDSANAGNTGDVGGLIGIINSGAELHNSYSLGKVNGPTSSTSTQRGVGGLI